MLDFLLGNDGLSAIVAFALVLIPAIIIHELGHFLAAKSVGIAILEFGIGFPPRMVTLFTYGETEYTLNWLPIGGFVRPLGEDFVKPISEEQVRKEREDLKARIAAGEELVKPDSLRVEKAANSGKRMLSVNEAKPLARIFFMAAGSLANLLTAFLMFTLIAMSGLPTAVGASVGIVALDADGPLAAAGVQPGDLIETLNGEYFDSSAGFFERLSELDGQPAEIVVQRGVDGEMLTLRVENPAVGVALDTEAYVYISNIAPDSPASAAGIQSGDIVTAFNGEPFTAFRQLAERTEASAGAAITLTILRDGELQDITLTPRQNPPAGQGAIGIVIQPAYMIPTSGLIYVDGGIQQELVSLPFGEAARYAANRIGFFVESLVKLPGELIGGVISPEEARLISPLGISQIGGVFLQRSIEQDRPVIILEFIAVISVALGITNLLPLPMLDGGRILFVLIEMVRGRPISPEREGMVHLVGMALLLSLIVITFLNDIINPVTNLLP